MIRAALILLALCFAVPAQAASRDVFSGDRYVRVAQGASAQDVTRTIRRTRAQKKRTSAPRYAKAQHRAPLSAIAGIRREFTRAFNQPQFVRGRLVCAINVNRALAARGIKGTGSALAMSYRHWGRASGPVPGAVAVFSRRGGGHVAIVDHVRSDGTVIYRNPSARRQAWVVGPYRRRPISYRVAS